MKTFIELEELGLVRPMIKNKYGFKIPPRDLEILVSLCRDPQIAERVKSGYYRSDGKLSDLLKFYIRDGNGDFKPTVISDSDFDKLENINAMFRATSNASHDINTFLNSKIVLRDGDNGSGVYFSEGSGLYLPNYVVNHLKDKPVNEPVGNIYKVALNPDASIVNKMFLFQTMNELKKSIDNGCYLDGTKLNLGCDKEVLKRLLSNDVSVVALLMGANAIYVPFRECATVQGKSMFLGHYILLDKSPAVITENTDKLNAKVNITKLKTNPEPEIEKIKSILIKH